MRQMAFIFYMRVSSCISNNTYANKFSIEHLLNELCLHTGMPAILSADPGQPFSSEKCSKLLLAVLEFIYDKFSLLYTHLYTTQIM